MTQRIASANALLGFATAIAVVSFFSNNIWSINRSLLTDALLGYVPILCGLVCMWLCFQARKKTYHKRLVLMYAILLAPFAFCYPAWFLILWILYGSGAYRGPMP